MEAKEIERLQEVLSDEAFAKELIDKDDVKDVQAALEAKGFSLDEKAAKAIGFLLLTKGSGIPSIEKIEEALGGSLSFTFGG